jgi:RNA 3'-terminal phosphate cyclase (ATP)
MCGGELVGGVVGSESIIFHPGSQWKSHIFVDISTAGSIGLILQTLQLGILAKSQHELTVVFRGGGTFGKWAPSVPYITNVTWEILKKLGYEFEVQIDQHGFFPKGGAMVKVKMKSPSSIHGINLERDDVISKATVLSIATQHLSRSKVAERQAEEIRNRLRSDSIETELNFSYVKANNPGSGVLVYSKTGNSIIAGDAVGEKRKSAEVVGGIALEHYLSTLKSQSCVDAFLADQILPVLSLTKNSSSFTTPEITNHTSTNIELVKLFLGAEILTEKQSNNFRVTID